MVRYVVTHIGRDDLRTLAHERSGECTYATPEEAQAWIDAAMRVNSMDKLRSLFGLPLEVRPVPCWPGHLGPMTIYPEHVGEC